MLNDNVSEAHDAPYCLHFGQHLSVSDMWNYLFLLTRTSMSFKCLKHTLYIFN